MATKYTHAVWRIHPLLRRTPYLPPSPSQHRPALYTATHALLCRYYRDGSLSRWLLTYDTSGSRLLRSAVLEHYPVSDACNSDTKPLAS